MIELRDKDEHGHGSNPHGGTPSKDDIAAAVNSWATSDYSGRVNATVQANAEDAVRGGRAGSDPICAGIRENEVSGSSYRGQVVSANDPILGWEKGQEVQVMPSSFSAKADVANSFATGDNFANPTTDNDIKQGISDPNYKSDSAQVILQVSGEHNAIDVDKITSNKDSENEHEHIVGGRFTVT